MTDVQIVVMGVSGCGKSTLGEALARRLGRRFIDGDALHPPGNIAKMSAGVALTDTDRWPWLAAVRQTMRGEEPLVIACSALRRSYRDLLRHAGNVVFVFLDIDRETATARLVRRPGHFMPAGLVDSQFAALERPDDEETDVAIVAATVSADEAVDQVVAAIAEVTPGTAVNALLADGGADRRITDAELRAHLAELVRTEILANGHQRVLLVPPDHTRLHSRAGVIAMSLRATLLEAGCQVGVMPALGTHVAMGDEETATLFGAGISANQLLVHDWRNGLHSLGEISADEVGVVTDGRYSEAIEVAVAAELSNDWDVVISIGQVVPHEVIGMANFTKNLMIGLGGAPTINRSHFVGAVAGIERVMGQVESPVRDLVDAAFDRYLAFRVNVLWILTVVEDADDGTVLRGVFAGHGGSMGSGGAAYRAAAALAQQVNVRVLPEPEERVVCWLDPAEMHSTWLGNKAIYRTRMLMADDAELVVLAPGVRRFGEDDRVDALIRRHGYRGTPATLAAIDSDPQLAASLGAAAHLIHGSTEGRFRVVYCTDPEQGGLSRADIESVGFQWRPLAEELSRLDVDGATPGGYRTDVNGGRFYFVANPALGLWSSAQRLGSSAGR